MTAKVSVRGLRFFAHRPTGPPCPGKGETMEHRLVKAALADAVKAAGWNAELEAHPDRGDTGGWRADVMAARPDGVRRIAFEVQLAGMTVDEGNRRTDRYAVDGVETIWVTTKHARWLHRLPSVRVVTDSQAGWTVDRGVATWEDGHWSGGARRSLRNVVKGMLQASVVRHDVTGLVEGVARGTGTVEIWHDHAIALVSAGTLMDEDRFERRRAVERAERERHERRIEALRHRQAAVLPALVGDALHAAGPGQGVFVGVPGVRVVPGRLPDPVDAGGNESTAFGVVAWVGSRRLRRLFGVGSPVVGRISPSLVRSWARRGVEVYAADAAEKVRLEHALGTAVAVRVANPRIDLPLLPPTTLSPRWSSNSRG